jgi:predicted Zn-dependent protease
MTGGLLIGLLTKGKSRDIASLAANGILLKHSRQDEYDADKRGVSYLSKAGDDPYGLPRFLQVLESKHGGGATKGPASWLATHPANSERVKRAYAYADEAPGSSRTSRSNSQRSNSNRYGGSSRRAPDLFGTPRNNR